MIKNKTTIYALEIYLRGQYKKFCSLEFTTIEKARTYLSNIALAEKIVILNDIAFNVADFKYAIIKEMKK